MPRAKPVPRNQPNEEAWWLKSLPYGEYLQSRWWRRRKAAYIKNVESRLGTKLCELCRIVAPGDHDIVFHVHHIRYANLANEPDDDLILLCSPCHNLVHKPDSAAARHWASLERNTRTDLAGRAYDLDPDRLVSLHALR